jgi:glycosyltransferase involved in cell wall biosynthesis
MNILLSILIPAITERLEQFQRLVRELESQINAQDLKGHVEIVSVMDNRAVSIGMKRQAVLSVSHGRYVAYVDDDDWVEPDYLIRLVEGAMSGVDVVTFQTRATIENHLPIIVDMRLKQINEQATFNDDPSAPRPVIKRAAWHTCAWRRDVGCDLYVP